MINEQELETIKAHLCSKPFSYEEVYDEVLDHYATAYEASTVPLKEVIEGLDKEFTDSKIRSINSKYFQDLKKTLRKSSWSLFLGNFRWPHLITTLIYVVLLFFIVPLAMGNKWVMTFLFVSVASIPIIMGFYYYLKWVGRKWGRKTHLKNAHAELSGIAFGLSAVYMQLPGLAKIFMGDDFKLLQYDPILTGSVLLLGIVLLSTSLKMITSKIKPAIV
ncbi:MAG: hypothetical protein AAF391_01630 [Bacteroidota bacterium]